MVTHSRRALLRTVSASSLAALAGCMGTNNEGNRTNGEDSDDGSGSSDDPIKIGGLIPFDHPNGKSIRNGLQFAVEQKNAEGGLLGREIEFIPRDTKLETQTTVSETRRLINQDDVDFLAGGYLSESTLAIQNQIAGSGPIFVNTGSASPRMAQRVKESYEQYKYFFKSNLSSPMYGLTLRDFYRDVVKPAVDVERVVVLAEDLTWTKPVAPKLSEVMPEIGIEVVEEIRHAYDTSDYSPIYSRIQQMDVDAIINVQSGAGATPVVQWWDQQVPLPMYGVTGQGRSDDFYNQTGGKCLTTTTNLQGVDAEITDKTPSFVSSFEESFGHVPVGVAYTSFDGLMSLFSAIESSGSDDTDELISKMESQTYNGVSGTIDYQGPDADLPHDPTYGIDDGIAHTYVQWQEDDSGNGYKPILFPEAWADSDGAQKLMLPPWLQ